MERKLISFKCVYLIYLSILTLLVSGCIGYVYVLLNKYEEQRPERQVKLAIEKLAADASSGEFWNRYPLKEIEKGIYEEHLDIKGNYLAMFDEEKLTFSKKVGMYEENVLYYVIENGERELAEVKLKAMGPSETKLAVLNFREWKTEYVKPMLEKGEYSISVPNDFQVVVNGIALTSENMVESNDNEVTYVVHDVYQEPIFEIADRNGNEVSYAVHDYQVNAEFYNYSLTLPSALTVELNGEVCQGEKLEGNRIRYDICVLTKPEMNITDYYGNIVRYEGGDELPLTYITILADSRYAVEVSGKAVPEKAVSGYENPEYKALSALVKGLPQIKEYDIAVLEADAEIKVTDETGNPVSFDKSQKMLDFTLQTKVFDTVPEEVSAEVDVLKVAQIWSLFMSQDASFKQLEKYLIPDSYQYDVVKKYATGVDITFTSAHTLANPAFTDASVTNFSWITEECFSVDISFVKHMIVGSGKRVDDLMNDRFYFVKYDATDDGIDNGAWKIASMKEIVE